MYVLYRNAPGELKSAPLPADHPILRNAGDSARVPDFMALLLSTLKDLDCSEADLRHIISAQNRLYGALSGVADKLYHRNDSVDDFQANTFAVTNQLDSLSLCMMAATQVSHQWRDLKALLEDSGVNLPVSLVRETFKRTLALHSTPGYYISNNVDFNSAASISDALNEGLQALDDDRIHEAAPVALFFLSALESVFRVLHCHDLETGIEENDWGFARGQAPLNYRQVVDATGKYTASALKTTWHPGMSEVPAGSLAGALRKAVITPTKGNVHLSWVWPLPASDAGSQFMCRRTLPQFLSQVNKLLPGGRFTCSFLCLPSASSGPFPANAASVSHSQRSLATHLQLCYVWDVTHSTSVRRGNPLERPQGVAEAERKWNDFRPASNVAGSYVRQYFPGISPDYAERSLQRLRDNVASLQKTYEGILDPNVSDNVSFLETNLKSALSPVGGRDLINKVEDYAAVLGMPGVSARDTVAYALSILAVPHLVWETIATEFDSTELLDVSHLPISRL